MYFQTQFQARLDSIEMPSLHNPSTKIPFYSNMLRDCKEESVLAKSVESLKNDELACDKDDITQEDVEEPIPYEPRDVPSTTNLPFEESSNTEDDSMSLCSQFNQLSFTNKKDSTDCQVVNQVDESKEKVDDLISSDIEEIRDDFPNKKKKSNMESKHFDIYEYISKKLRTFASSLHKSNHNRRKPRKFYWYKKQVAINKWLKKLISKVEIFDSRSDAYFTAVAQQFTQFSELLLNLIELKGDYKGDDLKTTLDSYLDCFKGFMQYFKVSIPEYLEAGSEEEYELINLFLDFIVITFPKNIVKFMLQLFNGSDSPQIFSFSFKTNSINLREATSIADLAKIFIANSAFKLICIEYYKIITNINDDIKESIQKIISKFNN